MPLKPQAFWGLLCSSVVGSMLAGSTPAAETPGSMTLENDYVRYVIGPDGKNLSFFDKHAGKERLVAERQTHVVTLRKSGAPLAPTACRLADGRLTAEFKDGLRAVLKVAAKKHYFVFEVESVSDPAVEEIRLANVVVQSAERVSDMSGVATDDEFAAALRSLNLQMLGSVGGRPAVLAAVGSAKYGLAGGRVALVGCPAGEIRTVLKELLQGEGALWSPLGGPSALDAEEIRGSYVFASVSEKNADEWIAMAKLAGIAQIHFIGWERTLGHYEPRKELFPNGLESLKAVVDKIHAAGLKAGMHTLTGCISPHDPWVTPVPDARLAKDVSFTLAQPLDEKQDALVTEEKPEGLDTIWAYASRGNVLRIGNELIQYSRLVQEPPYGFTGCKRGAFGTKAEPHPKGAAADHLFVRYGSFLPDESSTLVDGVADQIANVFNTCGFDMIYMDGAEGMGSGWHGIATMRAAIFRRLTRRTLVEASCWDNPSWVFHSRIGAWDHPNWALKRFVDIHCRDNEGYRKASLLPVQLGWWAILGPGPDHDAELPDEFEHLSAKALGHDMPMSFQGVYPGPQPANARQSEYLAMLGNYERLRLSCAVPESIRAKLREPKEEFHLAQTADGRWQFVPTDYAVHKVTGPDDGSQKWTVVNRYAAQPLRLRIQALYSVAAYDSPDAIVLADFGSEKEFGGLAGANGITPEIAPSQEQVKTGGKSGRYSAASMATSREGAWARVTKTFDPDLSLQKCDALGVWVHGDGKGELLNLQLTNPPQYWTTYDEHYVKVDFTGWRYVELLLRERDAESYGDYWNSTPPATASSTTRGGRSSRRFSPRAKRPCWPPGRTS